MSLYPKPEFLLCLPAGQRKAIKQNNESCKPAGHTEAFLHTKVDSQLDNYR